MAFVLFVLLTACGAVVELLLDLIPSSSGRTGTGHLFWIIVAVMDSRAARIVTVANFRPKHRLFVGVLATILFRKTALDRAIPGATVDRARTKSSGLVLGHLQPTLWPTACPRSLPMYRGDGASTFRFHTWGDFTTSTQALYLVQGRT
jgi:hypothetical protein